MIVFLITGNSVSYLALSTTTVIDPSFPFQDAESRPLASRTASAFAVFAEIAFIQFNSTVKNLIGSLCQMVADEHANFAIKQNGGIGLYA